MRKRHLPLVLITALAAVLALVGYLRPEAEQKMPVRILFKSSGGKVVFTHLKHHRDFEIACAKCHHERTGGEDGDPLPCGSCHAVDFSGDWVREHIEGFPNKSYCADCHHAELGSLNYDHASHEEYAGNDCRVCHHGPDIEDTPQSCSNCHTNAGEEDMPSVRQAAHDRCVQCHSDMFDKGVNGCSPCHRMKDMKDYSGDATKCSQCHQKPGKDLILNRGNAFHDQCMGCHREGGKGPYGEDACYLCHIQ